jgi:hypothetical protein
MKNLRNKSIYLKKYYQAVVKSQYLRRCEINTNNFLRIRKFNKII